MPLGWIDFSKTERNKVLSVLDLLATKDTLDELGISPVRDGFAELFFPGISTIQTRAKYFLIVPYALKDMELSTETNAARMAKAFDQLEQDCAKKLMEKAQGTTGIIGSRSIENDGWVKRPPSSVYWAGLRSFGIFQKGFLSLPEYLRAVCALKAERKEPLKLGNRNDHSDNEDHDDSDAGTVAGIRFWDIPTYSSDWLEQLKIQLTPEEGAFLKKKIMSAHPDCLMSYVLKNNMSEYFVCSSFQELESLIQRFPEPFSTDYMLALAFSDFQSAINAQYNLILSDGKNEEAVRLWNDMEPDLESIAALDLDGIFARLGVKDTKLYAFLNAAKTAMLENDIDRLQTEICLRERYLKGNRAKTMNTEKLDPQQLYGISQLDYRFSNAKVIMKDILESEGVEC